MSSQIEPGYCIATVPGPISEQAKILFRRRDTDAARYFLRLNADTPYVLPGHMMIIADPSNNFQTTQLEHLRRAKDKVSNSMKFISGDLALFMVKNHDIINDTLDLSSKGVEYTTEFGAKYFKQIASILQKIEKLYQEEFSRTGKIGSQQFYTQRAILFAELKTLIRQPVLNKIVPKAIKMLPYLKLARALSLSTSSIVHQWATAGVAGSIRGYADKIEASTKAVKFFKAGGYVTLGLGFMMTTNDVALACATGREDECRRAALSNYMGFGGATVLSGMGATRGAVLAESICLGAGIASGGFGLAVCVAGGALAGGAIGGAGGQLIGHKMGELSDYTLGRVLVD